MAGELHTIATLPPGTLDALRQQVTTAEHALLVFAPVRCRCGQAAWQLHRHDGNNGLRLQCAACDALPFPTWFLPQGQRKRRSAGAPPLSEVIAARGAFCYGCGTDQQVLRQYRTHLQVHHVRPYADHAHDGPFIPLCAPCHEHVTAVQRLFRLLSATRLEAAS